MYISKITDKINFKIQELHLVPGLLDFVKVNCFLAGGAIRDLSRETAPKDYDIFFKTQEAIDIFKTNYSEYMNETSIGNFNYNDFQFITLIHGTPKEVINTFDWTVNMGYYDFSGKYYYNWESTKELCFNTNSRKPLAGFLRLGYLLSKGYTITQKELLYISIFLNNSGVFNSEQTVTAELEYCLSDSNNRVMYPGNTFNRALNDAINRSPLASTLRETKNY